MIPDYANHAANERTFLAWVRTGVAVIALGFVVEKFTLFLALLTPTGKATPRAMEKLSGLAGAYGGALLVVVGVALIVLAILRFLRTRTRLLAATAQPEDGADWQFAVLTLCVLFVAAFSLYVALG
jgi:putative membrane protein